MFLRLYREKLSSMLVQCERTRDGNKREAMKNMYKGTRAILHLDLDAFYASIEQRDHPISRQARHRGWLTRSAWRGGHRLLRGPQVRCTFSHAQPHCTAPLRIGARAILIAAARHPAASLAAVSAVLKTVPSIAMSR